MKLLTNILCKRHILFPVALFFAVSCSGPGKQPSKATDTITNEVASRVAPVDYTRYEQYVSCKIDGQPYLAYYAPHHTAAVVNTVNMPARYSFSTSADEEKINGKTKLSELEFNLFHMDRKKAGTYTSPDEFEIHGHTDFPENGQLKYVRFATTKDQQLMITSIKDGIVEGTFSAAVADENDPAHILQITDGHFKVKQGGKTSIKADENGDVNMDSLVNSIR